MKPRPKLLVKLEKLDVHRCGKCPKVFPYHSVLIKHMSHHDDWFLSHVVSAYVPVERAKIFKCDICTQSFDTNRDFMLHKVGHIQLKVRNERKIKRLYTNDDIFKPYKCPDCDYKFVAQSSLDEHSILHLPFPHICKCGIGYYKQQDLKCHIKLVHGMEFKDMATFSENVVHSQREQVKSESKPNSSKGSMLKAVLVKKKKPAKKKWKVKLKDENGASNENKRRFYNIPNPDIEVRQTDDNRYECPQCKKLFPAKKNVFIHYRMHTGARPYTCHLCEKSFNQSSTLTTHIKRHSATERIYVCKYCPKAFVNTYYRARHEVIHSAVKPYDCPGCGKAFHDPSALIRHKRIHTGDKRYKCPYCPKAFTDVSGLNGHKLRHDKKKVECEICLKKFYNKNYLKLHLAVHSQQRNFCCDYCKKFYSSKPNLAQHIQRHLNSEEPYECKQCHKKYRSQNHLRKHVLLVHTKVNFKSIVQCNDCSKYFTSKNSLLEHYLSIHSGVRCDKCLQYFACKTHLEKHRLKESVQCEICYETLFCENMREKHLKVCFAV